MYAVRSIGVSVHGMTLLDGVDLELVPGRVVAVVGPNGAGKSTLLKAMAGERRVSSGRIEIDGEALSSLSPAALAKRRAVLPQAVDVVFPYRVDEVVSLGIALGRPAAAQRTLVSQALETVELAHLAERVYGTLSGGEKQRVQLARVLAQAWSRGCRYLLLDEPTSGLDLAHQLVILRIARAFADAGGGVFAILHDLNLASMVADEVVALKDGCLVTAGAPATVLTDDLIAALYGVHARICGIPDGPFLLPQTARRAGD